mgnify:FL=1
MFSESATMYRASRSTNASENPDSLFRKLCDEHCKVVPISHEQFFTAEELRKIRQKRPKIQPMYRMQKVTLSKYQRAIADLSTINSIIDIM